MQKMLRIIAPSLLVICYGASVFAGWPGTSQHVNCAANPTPDGCVIVNGASVNTTTFFDLNGKSFQFHSDNTLYINGTAFSAGPNKVQMGSGHQAFIGNTCQTSTLLQLWVDGSDGSGQWINPSTSYPPKFANGALTYRTLAALTSDTPNFVNGATITLSALPIGLPLFATSGVLSKSNQTWNANDGAIFGCSVAEGAAIITTDNLANLTQGNTLNLGKSEWEWVHGGGVRAFHLCGATTLNGTTSPTLPNVNDNDFGIDSCNGPAFTASISGTVMAVTAITQGTLSLGMLIHGAGVTAATTIASFGTGTGGAGTYNLNNSQTIASEQMGGTDGSITLNNIWAEHNGASTATTGSNGPTHNVYIGSDCETLTITGGGYYAESPQGDTAHAGYQLKSRCASGGTITGATFAGVSQFLGNTDQMASAAMDFPCGGGPLNIGTASLGNVIELGQNDNQGGGHGLIKYGDGRSGDCSTNWFNNVINITNNWILIDLAVTAQSVYCAGGAACDNPGGFATATATNNKVVCNSTIVTCTFAALFPNATDAGGNVFYATRAAARAANPGVTGLGDCTGVTIATCPLPTPDALTALAASQPTGKWFQASSTKLRSVAYSGPTTQNSSGTTCSSSPQTSAMSTNGGTVANVMATWSGGTLDTDNEQILIWGGGHADYFGNEVYAFNFAKLAWLMLTCPSDLTGWNNLGGVETYPSDGRPVSRHTYSGLAYLPNVGMVTAMGSQAGQNGGCGAGSWVFNPSNLSSPWTQNTAQSNNVCGGVAATNPGDTVYIGEFANTNGFEKFNVAGHKWTTIGQVGNQDSHQSAAINTANGTMISVGGTFYDLFNLGTGAHSQPTVSGDGTCKAANAPGFAFYPPGGKYVCWNGGTTVYLLDPATNTFTAHSLTGTAPGCTIGCTGNVTADGIFGRFGWDATHRLFWAILSIDDDMSFFKPDF